MHFKIEGLWVAFCTLESYCRNLKFLIDSHRKMRSWAEVNFTSGIDNSGEPYTQRYTMTTTERGFLVVFHLKGLARLYCPLGPGVNYNTFSLCSDSYPRNPQTICLDFLLNVCQHNILKVPVQIYMHVWQKMSLYVVCIWWNECRTSEALMANICFAVSFGLADK